MLGQLGDELQSLEKVDVLEVFLATVPLFLLAIVAVLFMKGRKAAEDSDIAPAMTP